MKRAANELVRIDDKGEAHPIGPVASRRMREREGAFRVLPAPGHVVFMRFTGEDGRRDADDGAIVRLAGEITEPAALCDVLAMLVHTRWRGELQVLAGDERRSIFTDSGNIVGGETNVDSERLGEVMFRYGAIDASQRDAILEAMQSNELRFGETAVELGFVRSDDVYGYLGRQMEEIVFGAFDEDDGTFFFLEGFDADRLCSWHSISASILLMDGVTRMDEIKYFRQRIPSGDWVPVRSGKENPPAECVAVYDAIDGKRSVIEVGRASGQGEFETTKAIYALAQSNHVSVRPPRVGGGAAGIIAAANAALRTIHSRVDTAGRGTEFREALAAFATGGGVYDILFQGAGPDERGTFDPTQTITNLDRVAGDEDEAFLQRKLFDYVSFAVFTGGSLLGHAKETELRHDVQASLASLQPRD